MLLTKYLFVHGGHVAIFVVHPASLSLPKGGGVSTGIACCVVNTSCRLRNWKTVSSLEPIIQHLTGLTDHLIGRRLVLA